MCAGYQPSRRAGRRNTALGGLLERIPELDQAWLTARHPSEAHAERRWLRIEPFRKRLLERRIGNQAERYDHGGISRLGGDAGAVGGREQQRVQVVRLHRGVDTV